MAATRQRGAAPRMVEHSFKSLGPHGFHRIAYTEWGEPDNPHVVVCVHSLTRCGRDFDFLAAELARDFRVICPDVAGRGRSEWLSNPCDYTFSVYLADMAALLARVDAEIVDWVGTSMGGLIGMMIAGQAGNPIRRLVMNDVGPFIPARALRRLGEYIGADPRFSSINDVEAYLRQILAPFGPLTDAHWRHLALHSTRPAGDRLALAYDPGIALPFRHSFMVQSVSLWPVWDAVQSPVLVLRGANSDLLPADTARRMAQSRKNCELVEFPGVGHAPALMDPARLPSCANF